MTDKLELIFLRKQLLTIRQQYANRAVWAPTRPVFPAFLSVQLINGQLINSVIPVVQYAADPITAPTAYDPNVATSYISGLGNAYLYNYKGQQIQKVIVRHRWVGFTDPLVAGDVFSVFPTPITVPVTGGGSIVAYDISGMW